MLKKTLSIILTLTLICTTLVVGNVVFAETTVSDAIGVTGNGLKLSYAKDNNLYAHGVSGNSDDTEAWQCWQHKRDGEGNFTSNGTYYFFLPSSAKRLNTS